MMLTFVPPPRPAGTVSDETLVDWSVALNALPTRLRQLVGLRLATEAGMNVNDARGRFQLGVLECATAMDRMNVLLLRELQRYRGLGPSSCPAGAAPPRDEGGATDHPSPMVQRQRFRHRMERILSDAEDRLGPAATVALLTIDVEGFRTIAEGHGPDVSDHVLRIIAARVSGAVRTADMVGRIGAQEFGCLMIGAITRGQLCQAASRILDATSAPLRVGALWLQVTPSIGIAHGDACAAGAAGMLLGANAAMLRSRPQGIGYAFFEPPSRRLRRPATSPRRAASPVVPT